MMDVDALSIGPNALEVETLAAGWSISMLLWLLLCVLGLCCRRRIRPRLSVCRLTIYRCVLLAIGRDTSCRLRTCRWRLRSHTPHAHRGPLLLTLLHGLSEARHPVVQVRHVRHGLHPRHLTQHGMLLLLHLHLPHHVLLEQCMCMLPVMALLQALSSRQWLSRRIHLQMSEDWRLRLRQWRLPWSRRARDPAVSRQRSCCTGLLCLSIALDEEMHHILGLRGVAFGVQRVGEGLLVVDQRPPAVEESLPCRGGAGWDDGLDVLADGADGGRDRKGAQVELVVAFNVSWRDLDPERDARRRWWRHAVDGPAFRFTDVI